MESPTALLRARVQLLLQVHDLDAEPLLRVRPLLATGSVTPGDLSQASLQLDPHVGRGLTDITAELETFNMKLIFSLFQIPQFPVL